MARKKHPDHAGRMPDHPRYGNPSDPTEETVRIRNAHDNVEKWRREYAGEFSGGVTMQYGSGKVYEVPIGNPEIAQKISGRALGPTPETQSLPEPAEFAPEPTKLGIPPPTPPQSWVWRLINLIKGEFR